MFRFCFTLDTEPDNLWANRPTLGFEHFDRLAGFHRDLTDRGARPSYLTTSEVAEDPAASRVLSAILETGQAELGAHFHSWTRSWPFDVPTWAAPRSTPTPTSSARTSRSGCSASPARASSASSARSPSRSGRPMVAQRRLGPIAAQLRHPGRLDGHPRPLLGEGRAPPGIRPRFSPLPRTPFYLSEGSLEPADRGELLELPVGASFLPNRRMALDDSAPSRAFRKLARMAGGPSASSGSAPRCSAGPSCAVAWNRSERTTSRSGSP